MTDEQKELFSRYTDAVREHQMTTDCLIFQNGFKLGARETSNQLWLIREQYLSLLTDFATLTREEVVKRRDELQ